LERVGHLAAQLRDIRQTGSSEPALTKVLAVTDGLALLPECVLGIELSLTRRLEYLALLQPEFVHGDKVAL
jgi:hypothetical protein